MKLSIIKEDNAVVVDGTPFDGLDLGPALVPSDIHALQWDTSSGWIEYKDISKANQDISVLPSWATASVTIHADAIAARNASLGTPPTAEEDTRAKRDQLLRETDWWASTDLTMTAEQLAYRQSLRDITGQVGFPDNIIWPTKPTQGV